MTQKEFKSCTDLLAGAYHRKFAYAFTDSDETIAKILNVWYGFFKDFRMDTLEDVIKNWIDANDKPPTISDIKFICRDKEAISAKWEDWLSSTFDSYLREHGEIGEELRNIWIGYNRSQFDRDSLNFQGDVLDSDARIGKNKANEEKFVCIKRSGGFCCYFKDGRYRFVEKEGEYNNGN